MKTVDNSSRNFGLSCRVLRPTSRKQLFVAAAYALSLSLTGCVMSSISESSGSISDSSTSSSKSSKSSSDESRESYLRDIKQYTAVYIRANSDMKGLTKGLATISEKHGVTDWEAYSATFLGIGEGFAKAALTQQQVDQNAAVLAQGDQVKVAMIQQGFRTGL